MDNPLNLRCILLSLTFVISALLTGRADANCYDKFAFDQVRIHAQGALKRGDQMSEFQKIGLDRALRQLTLSPIAPRLQARGLESHAPFLGELFAQLAELRRLGHSQTTSLSYEMLDKGAQIFEELCLVEQEIDNPTEVSQIKQILERIESSLNNGAISGNKADIRSFANLSLVFFILLGLISLIVFCWKSYVIAFPLLMNRKSCKIQATLRVLDADVSGYLVILGARGSRFIPSDADQQEGLITLLKTLTALPKTSLIIRGEPFAVKLHVVSSAHCVSYFETRLDRNFLNRLFTYSTETTQFMPKTAIQSNLNAINPKFT